MYIKYNVRSQLYVRRQHYTLGFVQGPLWQRLLFSEILKIILTLTPWISSSCFSALPVMTDS